MLNANSLNLEEQTFNKTFDLKQQLAKAKAPSDLFKSNDLEVTESGISGYIMKAVENVGIFSGDNYHRRSFKLEFG